MRITAGTPGTGAAVFEMAAVIVPAVRW